jgi:hypothetical protein
MFICFQSVYSVLVGFVLSLLNRPTDPRSMIRKVRPKKSYFLSAWEYVKLPFSLRDGATVNAGFVGFIVNILTLKNASEKVRTKKCVRKRVTSCLHGST